MKLALIIIFISFLVGVWTWLACNHFRSRNYFWFGVFGTQAITFLAMLIVSIIKGASG